VTKLGCGGWLVRVWALGGGGGVELIVIVRCGSLGWLEMSNALEALKQFTTVVSDSGEFEGKLIDQLRVGIG